MNKEKKRPLIKRIAIDIAGFGLIIAGGLLGWLPGPGGIPLVLAGLGLLSLNYTWAEKLLKNFDQKRQEYTQKYLMANRKVSIVIDFVAILTMIAAVYVLISSDNVLLKGLGGGGIAIALTVLLSNQKRFERLVAHVRRK